MGHEAYNAWHQLDHMPEQFTIEGITFGQRWVRSPRCRAAEAARAPARSFHYMTLYLMRDDGCLPEFFALANGCPPRTVSSRPGAPCSPGPSKWRGGGRRPVWRSRPEAVPFRPSKGVYVVVGPPVDGAALVEHHGVAGAWQFADTEGRGTVRVAFVDGDLWQVAAALGPSCAGGGGRPRMGRPAGTGRCLSLGWFATLTPQ